MKSGRYFRVFRSVAVRHFETQVVILDIGLDSRVRLRHTAEFSFQSLSRMTQLMWHRRESVSHRSFLDVLKFTWIVEPWVVWVKDSLDGPLSNQGASDPGRDALTGHIGQFLVHELSRICSAFADQTGFEPLFGDAFQLTEQV